MSLALRAHLMDGFLLLGVTTRDNSMQVVLQAIENHPANVPVVQEACTAIWALSDKSLSNQTSMAEEGCVELLLQALRDHIAIEGIQREGFRALMALTAGHEQNLEKVCSLTVTEAHTRGSAAFTYSQNVAQSSCVVWQVQEGGVVRIVIAGMKEHAASADVQQHCCSALANLAEHEPAKNEIVAEEGISLVLKVQPRLLLAAV
jgi:hypothetical protein